MNSIILSPVGTSIFTKGDYPREISQYSNARTLEDIPPDRRGIICTYIDRTEEMLHTLSMEELQLRSAELNGIVLYYGSVLSNNPSDIHYLLPSDTYIGRKSCQLIETYLRKYFTDVRIMEIKDLQTSDCDTFQYALSELAGQIMWLKESLLPSQRLIFNLTGGFKSILGFLQSLGMFYADETVYVFEFSKYLLRIPALPIKLEPYEHLWNHVSVFRRLDNALPLESCSYAEIPSSLVLKLFGEPTLSAYGKVVWDSFRKQIYSREMLQPISSKLAYTPQFISSVRDLSSDRYYLLNCRIDALCVYLEGSGRKSLKSLDLKKLKIPQGKSTHEFDAWADQSAKRVFCHYENQTLVLDRLADALH